VREASIALDPASVADRSELFDIGRFAVKGGDTAEVQVVFRGELPQIDGLVFSWSWANPPASEMEIGGGLVMSGFVLYSLCVYLWFLKKSEDWFLQVVLVGVGVLGSVGCTGFPPFSGDSPLLDAVRWVVFAGVFRFFLVLRLQGLGSSTGTPGVFAVLALGVFSGIYGIVDGTAVYAESKTGVVQESIGLSVEMVCLGVAFAGLSVYYAWFSGQRWGVPAGRIPFLVCGMAVCSATVSVVLGLFGRSLKGKWRPLLKAVHSALAGAALLLLHSDSGPRYEGISEDGGETQRPIGMDFSTEDRRYIPGDEEEEEEEEPPMIA
jgi:hypothetical protein